MARFDGDRTMGVDSELARVAAALGDPARSRMLAMLMGGQARTAGELALDGGVSPSTASTHLARLLDAGLVEVARQGRHRYYRLAGPEVAAAIEALMGAVPALRGAGPARWIRPCAARAPATTTWPAAWRWPGWRRCARTATWPDRTAWC